VLGRNLAREFPRTNAGLELRVLSEIEGRWGSAYRSVRLFGMVSLLLAGLVLAVCCANVANLLLARGARRTKELGIRLALGAGRGRIVRQLMTESLLLALAGAALGLVVASWVPDLLHALMPPMPFQLQPMVQVDARTVGWAMGAALLSGVAFGSLPAWRAARTDLVATLKADVGAEGQRLRRGGLRHVLVIAQIAISVVVVLTGGLISRSLTKIEHIDPGFSVDTLVSGQLNPGLFYRNDDPHLPVYFHEIEQRLARLPGVQSVSQITMMPLNGAVESKGPVVRAGDAPPLPNQGLTTGYSIIHPRFFETIGLELLVGRDFTPAERVGTPAAVIVNAELAERLYGGPAAALGKRFRIGSPATPLLEIVGVARNGRYRTLLEEQPVTWAFLPGCAPELECEDLTFRTILVRAASERELPDLLEGFRREATALDPRIPIESLYAGRRHLSPWLYQPRMAAEMGALLALLALALATLGIYSVMTYAVSQRTKEIGIRRALGGQVSDVLVLVMKQGLVLVAIGVALGSLGALALGRVATSMLYGITGTDPPTFVGTIVLLVLVATVATALPARRATQVSPMLAIRDDRIR
jgi:predicted permease